MPSVCDCPYCGQPAAIPEHLESEVSVRCPRCDYEFSGDLALMNAVEAPPEHVAEAPPQLIAIQPDVPSPTVESTSIASSPAEEEPAPVPSATDMVEVPPEVAAASVSPGVDEQTSSACTVSDPPTAEALPGVDAAMPESAVSAAPPMESGDVPVEPASSPAEPEAATSEAALALADGAAASGDVAMPSGDPAAETALPETGEAVSPTESAVESTQESEPAATESAAGETAGHEPVLAGLGLRVPGELGTGMPTMVRRERRKGSPVRTVIGTLVFGLLGLATAYGLVAGISKLGLIGKASPATADSDAPSPDSTAVKTQAKDAGPLPEPKSYDEWPDLDDKRFSGAPKNVPASKSGKPAKRPGDRKGP